MIKVIQTPDGPETLRRVVHSINYSEAVLAFPAVGSQESVAAGGFTAFGGVAVDRSVFREVLPDARWAVYAAGWVQPQDANVATLRLVYQKDDVSLVTLGDTTATGNSWQKIAIGPFDVFGTASVPAGETIPMVRLIVLKDAGTAALVQNWNVWVRFLAAKQ